MEEKTIDRVVELMDHYGLSKNAFDASIGKANGYIGKQIKKRASIGSDTVETILRVYREINPSWLIAGEGDKLRNSNVLTLALDTDSPEYEKDLFELTLLKYLEKPRVKEKIKNLMNDGNGQKEAH